MMVESDKLCLAEALLKCETFQIESMLETLIRSLPADIKKSMRPTGNFSERAYNIVDVCENRFDGLQILIKRLMFFENNSIPFREVQKLFGKIESRSRYRDVNHSSDPVLPDSRIVSSKSENDQRSICLNPSEFSHIVSVSGANDEATRRSLRNQLPEINFREVVERLESVLNQFDIEGDSALFALQQYYSRGGIWCVERIHKLLHKNGESSRRFPLGSTNVDSWNEQAIVRCLADHLGCKTETEDLSISHTIDILAEKLCALLMPNSVILFELKNCEDFERQFEVLQWYITDFWSPLITRLLKTAKQNQFRFIKCITIATTEALIDPDFQVSSYWWQPGGSFEPSKFINLPMNLWTQEDIQEWLERYWLKPKDIAAQKARNIYAASEGMPELITKKILDPNLFT